MNQRYVLVGLSRLTARVAEALAPDKNRVVVLYSPEEASLLPLLHPEVNSILMTDRHQGLRDAVLTEADSLLALSDDDMQNLRVALTGHEIAPDVPVVLRTFDPTLAEAMERWLNIRRAYSVSSLSAPAFVAATLADRVLETLNIGDEQVLLCEITVEQGSRLAGASLGSVRESAGCDVLAVASGDSWTRCPGDDRRLLAGDRLLAGGLLMDVLRLARDNALSGMRRQETATGRRGGWRPRRSAVTLLPVAVALLLLVFVFAVLVFWRNNQQPELSFMQALYFVVATATTIGYGDINLRDERPWLQAFGILVMLSSAALMAVLYSHLAALLTADRLRERHGRMARGMSGHVVISGLGNVGYRVEQLLGRLDIPTVVVERDGGGRFLDAVSTRAVVLLGDARLPERLMDASADRAFAFIGSTNDDLANIQACLQVRKMNPATHTVMRIFDGQLADRLGQVVSGSAIVNPLAVAASAFVGAATGGTAARRVAVGGQEYVAFRHRLGRAVSGDELREWRQAQVHVLASRSADGVRGAWPIPATIPADAQIVVSGPEDAVRARLAKE